VTRFLLRFATAALTFFAVLSCGNVPAQAEQGLVDHAAGSTVYQWRSAGSFKVVRGVTDAVAVNEGNYGGAAMNSDGTVTLWGVPWGSKEPFLVHGFQNVIQLTNGNDDYAALESNGTVWMVGQEVGGDFGNGVESGIYATAVEVPDLPDNIVQIAGGADHMLALARSGQVYAWGVNADDALALPKKGTGYSSPVVDPPLTALTDGTSTAVEIAGGSDFAAMLVNRTAYTWGNNGEGQCGCGSAASIVASPVRVEQPVDFTSISSGGGNGSDGIDVALGVNGHAYCWGDDADGECGQGSLAPTRVPTLVPGLPSLTQASAGGQWSCYLDAAGSVWTAGYHEGGTTVREQFTSGISMVWAGAGSGLALGD